MARTNNGTPGNFLSYSGTVANYPFTVAGWFKTTDVATFQVCWCESDSGLNNDGFLVGMDASGNAYSHAKAGGGSLPATAGAVSVNTWVHLAAVFTSSTSRTMYLNGVAGSTDTNSMTPGSLVVTGLGDRIFGDLSYSSQPIKGKISHWAMWNTALSGANITSLAGGAAPNTVAGGSLVAYWVLAGTASPEPDTSGSGFNMTITGTMTGDTGDNPSIAGGGGGGGGGHTSLILLGVG